MSANWNLEEQEIVRLLTKLKSVTPEYPDQLRANRRAAFLSGIAAATVGGTVLATGAGKQAAKILQHSMSQVDKLILAVEIAAVTGLATYVGVTTYVHRDELKNLLFPPPTVVSLSTPPPAISPVVPTALPEGTGTPTLLATGTLPSGTTPMPPQEEPSEQPPTDEPPNNPPEPTEPPPDDRPGLHLGQTKTPRP